MMPRPMSAANLTGATRYRESWLGKLILQVEETYQVGYAGRPQPGKPTHFLSTRWRDARGGDLYGIDWIHRATERSPPPSPRKA